MLNITRMIIALQMSLTVKNLIIFCFKPTNCSQKSRVTVAVQSPGRV